MKKIVLMLMMISLSGCTCHFKCDSELGVDSSFVFSEKGVE